MRQGKGMHGIPSGQVHNRTCPEGSSKETKIIVSYKREVENHDHLETRGSRHIKLKES